jgi:ureidoacrylate peracid hydrolase
LNGVQWRIPYRVGMEIAEFYDGFAPLADERIVIKHRYSAFINTDLNTVLKVKGVESMLVTGVATNVCVETTARDGFMFDYYVTLVGDCCAAYELRLHDNTLENIRGNFGLVASSEEVIASWSERGRKKVVRLES